MPHPNLFALVLDLRAAGSGSLPLYPGHQMQALFLQLLAAINPGLAAELHADTHGARSYTIAPLRLPRSRGDTVMVAAGDQVALRVTLLDGAIFGPFTNALLQQSVHPTLRLGNVPFTLAEVRGTAGSDPWAGFADWEALVSGAAPVPTLTLEFATPTAVSQGTDVAAGGRERPRVQLLPFAPAIFGSLARRWNDLAPTRFELDAVKIAAETALVSDYELRSSTVQMGTSTVKGFSGWVRYEVRGNSEQQRLLALLADAAFYLGVGAKTARGMGLCRRVR